MTYEETMKTRCSCGECIVGVWNGDHNSGHPSFSRVSMPQILPGGIVLTTVHTLNACYSPRKILTKVT